MFARALSRWVLCLALFATTAGVALAALAVLLAAGAVVHLRRRPA